MALTDNAQRTVLRMVKRFAGAKAAKVLPETLGTISMMLRVQPDEVTKFGYFMAANWLQQAGTRFAAVPSDMKLWGEVRTTSASYLREVFEGQNAVSFSVRRLQLAIQAYRLRLPSHVARDGDYETWTEEVVCWMTSLGVSVDEMETYREFPWQEAYRYAWDKVPADYARALRRVTNAEKILELHRQKLPLEYALSLITG